MTSIQMPQLGETIVEGTILKWLKNEGDEVKADEPLFEISTDKVDTEVPSPVAGTVTKLLVAEGTTVPVGTAVMEIDDGSGASGNGSSAPEPAAAVPAAETPAAAPAQPPAMGASAAPPSPAPQVQPSGQPAPAPSVTMPDRGPRSNILSPIVRKLAHDRGIDLTTIAGTGEGGRITKADVLAATAAPAASSGTVTPLPSAGPAAAAVMVAPPSMPAGQGEDAQPMSHVRKAIAGHMLASAQQTARAWTMVEVNVDRLVRLRAEIKEKFQANFGVKLTYLPMVTRATIDALQQFPLVNSRLDGENIVTPRFVNMGIAVSYDAGLIVPVVKGADGMNTVGIARAIADLAARARSHQLQPDEVQGATFTITNPGPYGSLVSVPIINQPNAGILSLDAIQKRPVVVEDDAIAVRSMVYISMSWDHRLIDGELATRFLARVKHNLETWDFAEDLGL
ncbi:MAG TPA: 2-oxoglutarate dehydrogenase, E2 component, dihydrolipoamide succinyltransferase [Actinomycetota bacterium]|nr:2-oxoglutarate dehydrogenase, E2 component, dihydrolipoamide succinyltransferase [Actinomycetota bacterium]